MLLSDEVITHLTSCSSTSLRDFLDFPECTSSTPNRMYLSILASADYSCHNLNTKVNMSCGCMSSDLYRQFDLFTKSKITSQSVQHATPSVLTHCMTCGVYTTFRVVRLVYWSHYTTVCLITGYLEVVVVCTLHGWSGTRVTHYKTFHQASGRRCRRYWSKQISHYRIWTRRKVQIFNLLDHVFENSYDCGSQERAPICLWSTKTVWKWKVRAKIV